MANAYCTIAQMLNYFDVRVINGLCSDAGVQGDVETASDSAALRLQEMLDAAASEVESYLYGRIALPITATIPILLRRLVVGKTAEMIYMRRADSPEAFKGMADWANDWLDKFRLRKVTLPSIDFSEKPVLSRSLHLDNDSEFDDLPFFNSVREQDQ